jgi:hypothetical protein
VQLSNGRLVSNPLATLIRFAGATRSEGQFRLPTYQTWNARLGYRFRFQQTSFEAAAEVFNITNNAAELLVLPDGVQTFSPNFGKGRDRQLPRGVQVSFRLVR